MVLDNTFEALQSMYPSVIGINDADSSMMASIENNYPPGMNTGNAETQSDHDTSGINNTKTVSVDTGSHSQGMQNLFSSSDFEGFHSSDILSDALNTNSHPSGHTPSITESYDGGENATDSEDTIPATDNISVNTTLPSNFFLTKQINEQYAPDVISLWKSDAMRKKWSVPILNLNKDEIYSLSKPAPNWQTMDPYSSLEDIGSDTNTAQPETVEHSSTQGYHRCSKCYATHKSTCKSKHDIRYVYNDIASTSDSDYDQKLKQIRDPNIGLKAPSNSRLCAQAIIHEAKAKSAAARSSGVDTATLPFDKNKNKQCCYCPNTFYYSAGLKTHIEHAPQNIVNLKE